MAARCRHELRTQIKLSLLSRSDRHLRGDADEPLERDLDGAWRRQRWRRARCDARVVARLILHPDPNRRQRRLPRERERNPAVGLPLYSIGLMAEAAHEDGVARTVEFAAASAATQPASRKIPSRTLPNVDRCSSREKGWCIPPATRRDARRAARSRPGPCPSRRRARAARRRNRRAGAPTSSE